MNDFLTVARQFFVLSAIESHNARTRPDAKKGDRDLFTVLHTLASGMRDLVDALDAMDKKLAGVESQLNRQSLVRRP